VRPWLSLVLLDTPVNKETQTLVNVMEKGVAFRVFHRLPKNPSELLTRLRTGIHRSTGSAKDSVCD